MVFQICGRVAWKPNSLSAVSIILDYCFANFRFSVGSSAFGGSRMISDCVMGILHVPFDVVECSFFGCSCRVWYILNLVYEFLPLVVVS